MEIHRLKSVLRIAVPVATPVDPVYKPERICKQLKGGKHATYVAGSDDDWCAGVWNCGRAAARAILGNAERCATVSVEVGREGRSGLRKFDDAGDGAESGEINSHRRSLHAGLPP